MRTVKGGYAFQPADHVGDMRTENAAVGVQFVNDDEFQVAKEFVPVGVMRQDARVEHVGIGEQEVGGLPDFGAGGGGGVAVVNASDQ